MAPCIAKDNTLGASTCREKRRNLGLCNDRRQVLNECSGRAYISLPRAEVNHPLSQVYRSNTVWTWAVCESSAFGGGSPGCGYSSSRILLPSHRCIVMILTIPLSGVMTGSGLVRSEVRVQLSRGGGINLVGGFVTPHPIFQ